MSTSHRPRSGRPPSAGCHQRPPRPSVGAPGADLTPERIRSVLEVLAGLDAGMLLVAQPDRPGHLVLGVRDLPPDPRCAGAGLFGMTVPYPCSLVAASFSGRPGHADAPALRPDARCAPDSDPDAVSVSTRVDALVTVTGSIHAQIHVPEGQPLAVDGAPGGIVIDALHRLLGLPSPGLPPPLTELVCRMWMHKVLSGLPDHVPSWADAAAAHLHPDDTMPARGRAPSTASVAASIVELADDASWYQLHQAASIGRMSAPELEPTEAEWMDPTMFARWLVDSFLPVDLGLATLREHGAERTAAAIAEAVATATPTHPEPRSDGDRTSREH